MRLIILVAKIGIFYQYSLHKHTISLYYICIPSLYVYNFYKTYQAWHVVKQITIRLFFKQ